ncbi:MAG: DUF6339 family protein [Roseburia sp.]|nr:DUF6339 family protein [Anaeroplasma bactoclasticum]MCM1195685.1 DUF6339 family protein [Roseburia sp.]MCM1556351.1 DUF6339 family protein [Anaeroplasma bactoclasticum]
MMEINIKFMKEAAYITLQKNPEEVYNQILKHPKDSLWIREYLGFDPYENKEYSIEDFSLTASSSAEMVFQNSITLYEHLSYLPRYILCNPRFWAWITFEKAYEVAQTTSDLSSPSLISSLWLIANSRRSLMLGAVSRFFFMVQISVDATKKDKYELTKYLLTNVETYRNFCYRNMGMLKNVTLAVIRAQKDICERLNIALTNKQSAEMVKETSKIGSVMLVDVMRQEEIYEIIYPKFLKIAVNVRE